ncbi:MAG TPA: molybdopterin-synthase adenylyltransferase MoeB [Kiritimatiellia bacterium]|nr:molybdopterin-synthase adenylyltransferase MoeB [Kiritimatiellia bacterium]
MTIQEFSEAERDRYSRHLVLPEVGREGQLKLRQARVLMVGIGGLGSPVGMYLAAAGVGTIGVVDSDAVDTSNLQRQIIHGTRDVGRLKVESARDRMMDINPLINVELHAVRLNRDNAMDLIKRYDVIVDGSDNLPTRYLVNDACVFSGKPVVHGSIYRFEGQVSVFGGHQGACYRCLYPHPPTAGLVPSCSEGGVLGVLPGLIGAIQASEAIKLIVGMGEPLINRLLLLDALSMTFRELKLDKDPDCPVCGTHPTITDVMEDEGSCDMNLLGKQNEAVGGMDEISVTELKRRMDLGENLHVVDVREPYEIAIARIPGTVSIPMGEIVAREKELKPDCETVIMCRSGGRSALVINELKKSGYRGRLLNLTGGILAWSDQVDPSVPRY